MKRAAREIGVFALFVVLTIVLTWPLGRGLSRFTSDAGDPLLVTAILDWDCWSLTHAPFGIYHAPWFYPARYPLALSENFIGVAILVLPFWLAGVAPITLYNLALILGFALSGYGAYVLARTCGTSAVAAIGAGVLFAFTPFKFDHLAHLQIISSGWLPLMFAALLSYWRTARRSRAVMLAVAFIINGLTNIHYLLFGGLTIVLTIGFLAMTEPKRDRRFWITLVGALVVAALVLLPFLLPYQIMSKEYGMHRGVGETTLGSAVPRDWLNGTFRSRWYGTVRDQAYAHAERTLFPGLVPLLLAGFAFFLRRRTAALATSDLPPLTSAKRRAVRWLDVTMILCAVISYFGVVTEGIRWTWHGQTMLSFASAGLPLTVLVAAAIARCIIRVPHALSGDGTTLPQTIRTSRFTTPEWCAALWLLIGFLGSLGLNAFFHQFLFRFVQIFQSVRAPARWAAIAYIGLAIWAAMGIDEIAKRAAKRVWRTASASALVALSLIDMQPLIRWESIVTERLPVYAWLKANVRGPVLELPMSGANVEYYYMLGTIFHRVPIMNGTSGFEPPLHQTLRDLGERNLMDDRYTALVEKSGCRFIVVQGDWLRLHRDATFRWLQRELARGRIAFLRRFEHGSNGDWVFAVTRNAPQWQTLRAAEVADAAGFTPAQNLARFLAGQHVYNANTFAHVDSPRAWSEVRGPLVINGWALSPKGVRRVVVHFDEDSQQFDAELFARPDIAHYFLDYYPQTTRAGFRFTLPERPRGVHLVTDIQVEIIDGEGTSTWLADVPFWWYR